MNVSELYKLTIWVSKEIEAAQIPSLYQALQQILQQNSQSSSKQPFEAQKDSLIKALEQVDLASLTKDQLAFLRELGIAEAVGDDGANAIEDVLYKNVIDLATAAQKTQLIYQEVAEGLAKSNQIKVGLTGIVSSEQYELDNEILMRVTFTGQAKMGNIKDFKTWGNAWYDIGRGIALAHGTSPEDIKIVGATTGSIIIELAVVASIATTASGIILAALKVAEKVLDIKKKAEEIRGLKLTNEKLAKDLDEAADTEKEKGIEEITVTMIKKLSIKKTGEGDKVKALETSIKNLVNFIEQGGEVDFIMPESGIEEGDEEPSNKELRVAFQEIRRLEEKIALIEHKKAD